MPQVRIIQPSAGKGFAYQCGEVVDLPDLVASKWIEKGRAEYVDKPEGVKPSAPPAKRGRKSKSTKAVTAEKR